MNNRRIIIKNEWKLWVTPRLLHGKPIHRWFVFPHSFTGELVHEFIDEWGLSSKDRILDPFVGAGTTILAAKEKGIPATGYDLSPLSIFVSQVKVSDYDQSRLMGLWGYLLNSLEFSVARNTQKPYSALIRKALPGKLLGAFNYIDQEVSQLPCTIAERKFFKLALLSTLKEFSRAIPTGGWLSWVRRTKGINRLLADYSISVEIMMSDLYDLGIPRGDHWKAKVADARVLPDSDYTYAAIITSPPYPNRHDYTRVFGIELMFGFLSWEKTRQLRYQSFHSHPESRPLRPEYIRYKEPKKLEKILTKLDDDCNDPRIGPMIKGYFIDSYLSIREMKRVLKPSGKIAIVIGNAQYEGISIPVDEIIADIGEQLGLSCKKLIVARFRGNSAQQMKVLGRRPSRETIVIFENNH